MCTTIKDIYRALESYNCQYSQDKEGNGVSLVDVITPRCDKTIERGILEMGLLAEHIADAIEQIDKPINTHAPATRCKKCFQVHSPKDYCYRVLSNTPGD